MGKHRRKQTLRKTPFARKEKPVVNESVRQETVLPLIASLKSADANERAVSVSALATLLEDRNVRHMLLRERLIKVLLSNILSDSSLETVARGFGVLRNIVLLEGRDPAVFLIREHTKVSVNHYAKQCMNSLAASAEDMKILNLLIENLCGLTGAIVMSAFDSSGWQETIELGLTTVLRQFAGVLPSTVNAAIEMLYYISEDISEEPIADNFSRESIAQLKTVALQSSNWSSKIYGIGIEFNYLMVSGDDMLKVCRQVCEFLKSVPREEVSSVEVSLELLAIAAQTSDLEQVLLLVSEVGPILIEMLPIREYRQYAVSVLNNIGWSLNALEQEWVDDARNIFEIVSTHCFADLEDSELISSALGLLGAALVQSADLAETQNFRMLVTSLLNRVETLYKLGDPEWIALARSLVVVLSSGQVAVRLGLVSATTDLLFLLLEHGDAEAQIDALNALFDVHGDNDAEFNEKEYISKNLSQRLTQLKPLLKRTLKSVPKTDEMLREQAIDALTNLDAFIAYKDYK